MTLDHTAIRKAYPNTVTIDDGTGAFDVNGDPITLVQSQIDEARVTLDSEWNATKYRNQRKTEYPEIGDQLDSLYHAGSFPADMAAKIKAVKDKYPKP